HKLTGIKTVLIFERYEYVLSNLHETGRALIANLNDWSDWLDEIYWVDSSMGTFATWILKYEKMIFPRYSPCIECNDPKSPLPNIWNGSRSIAYGIREYVGYLPRPDVCVER